MTDNPEEGRAERERVRFWRAPTKGWTEWRQILNDEEEWGVSISPGAEDCYFIPVSPSEEELRERLARTRQAIYEAVQPLRGTKALGPARTEMVRDILLAALHEKGERE